MASITMERLVTFFQEFGVNDFILPFILVFTIIFAVLRKTKLMGDKKNFDVVVALVLGLLFVTPHVMSLYPLGYDPVQVLNETLPSIALVAVAVIMLLLLMGIFGANFAKESAPWIAVLAILFVVYIFGASLGFWNGPYDIFYWWTTEVTELIVVLLVFALIVYFITKDPSEKSQGGEFMKSFGKLFEKK